MRAGVLFALFAIVALLLQTSVLPRAATILPRSALGRPTPDLLLIMCVYLGLHQHTVGGAVGAFFLGYLEDAFSGSALGLNAFGMCLVFTIVYLTSRRLWVDNAISKVVLVFLASVLKTLAVLGLVAVFRPEEGLSNSVPRYVLIEAMLVAVLAAVLSPPIFAVLAYTEELPEEEEEE